MRDAFIDELTTLAETNPQIALVVGDLGYNVVERFAERFPDRFINAGVAEQNMTGLAAGMASEGYHVFTYSIANFPTFRCAEQIRNDVDHHRLPVTVVAVGGGVAYGALGYSHHAVQDYALMRSMPNMVIAAPGDPLETRACLRWLVANPGPSYLRLGKAGEPRFHETVPRVSPGMWVRVREGLEAEVMLSTGAGLGAAIAHADDQAVYSLPLWSMAAKARQPAQLARHRAVMTYEDHLADGGFGSWLAESVAGTEAAARILPTALSPEICDQVASQATLNRAGGLV
jgi:transketolase